MDLSLKEKLMNIFSKLLSVHASLGRFFIKVFGIKFTYRNKLYLSTYLQAKKNGEDITKLPRAEGLLRKIQLANFVILKDFDIFCRQNNLKYWLAYGTQLGATRHKGYIPWDDDIDVAMMRDDYEKLYKIFDASTHNKNLYAELIKNKHTPGMLILKIRHKALPFLFIDIFPWDYYHAALNEEERKIANEKIIEARHNININRKLLKLNKHDLYDYTKNYSKNYVLANCPIDKNMKPDIFMGLDFPHAGKVQIMSYSDVFPLEEVDFEDYRFMQMKNPDIHLRGWFGNYMEYPREIFLGHFQNQIISKNESRILDKLIEEGMAQR